MNTKKRTVVGLTEKVAIRGQNGKTRRVVARIDTGAEKSSIDKTLARELKLGPVLQKKYFKSAHGIKKRPIIPVRVKFAGRVLKYRFSVVDRNHMRYKVLIGQNILKKGFLIDPSKK